MAAGINDLIDLLSNKEPDLPDGMWVKDGKYLIECVVCHQTTEWYGDLEDYEPDNPHNVCGGSPRCCP
jgi:hypothetical protein